MNLGCMLFYQFYTRMSFLSLSDVKYSIICFSCVTKKAFIDSNAQVANNIYRKCIKYFSDIFATRNCLIFLSKCYFITITRTFMCQKKLYSFPNVFIISGALSVQIFKETFFLLSKKTDAVIHLIFISSFVRLSFVFQKFVRQPRACHHCFLKCLIYKWPLICPYGTLFYRSINIKHSFKYIKKLFQLIYINILFMQISKDVLEKILCIDSLQCITLGSCF